jgi:hypothetical protein
MVNTMRTWLRKWYGDDGPFLAWPVTAFGIALLIVIPLFIINSDWGVLAMYSIQLSVVLSVVAWQWWNRSLKRKLRRWLAHELMGYTMQRGHVHGPVGELDKPGNLCGSGGQSFRPMTKTWQELFDEWPDRSLRMGATGKNNKAIVEAMFFGYFAPLEHWCERNLSHGFYLWSDNIIVSLIIPSEQDRIMWMLVWNDRLPTPEELDAI